MSVKKPFKGTSVDCGWVTIVGAGSEAPLLEEELEDEEPLLEELDELELLLEEELLEPIAMATFASLLTVMPPVLEKTNTL